MPTEARTPAGVVAGRRIEVAGRGVEAFGGVPYAWADRFAPPGPVPPWSGVRDATSPGPQPPQLPEHPRVVPGMGVGRTDEHCLNLEIWTPSTTGQRAVLVWIPGGAYLGGGASMATYEGSRLAADGDVVVVGVTYRVGALGFLVSDTVPSNLGLRDVRCALDWIRAHIAGFGGDPSRVVVMGESAGAGMLAHLLTDVTLPVDGAVVQSGSPGSALAPEAAESVTATFLTEAGVAAAADPIGALTAMPIGDLLAAQRRTCAVMEPKVGKMPFHPIVDGDVVPVAPLDAARSGSLAQVAVVVGTNAHELELYRPQLRDIPDEWAPVILARAAGGLDLDADALARGHEAAGQDLCVGIADVQIHVPTYLLADSQARRGIDAWRYSFTWESPERGACHALDLPFTFGTLDVDDWRAFTGADVAPEDADRLSQRMRDAWTSFARDGVPSCAPVGNWPCHTDVAHPVVRLGVHVDVVDDPDRTRRTAWMGEV